MKPTSRNLLFLFLISVSGTVFSSCEGSLEIVQTINEEYSGVTELSINSGFLDVSYVGDPTKTSVSIDAVLESSKPGRYMIEVDENNGVLTITLERNGSGTDGNHRGRLTLTGPQDIMFKLVGTSGDYRISQVNSPTFDIEMSSGNLDLNDISSTVINILLTSGKVEARNLTGDTDVEISSGNVLFEVVNGNVNAEGSSGVIRLNDVTGLVNAKLTSGNLDLDRVQEIGSLDISSGRIVCDDSGLGSATELISTSGNIEVQTPSILGDFNFDMSTSSGRVRVGDNSSDSELIINNGSAFTVVGRCSSGRIEIVN